MLVPSDFMFIGQSYEWWEDIVLLVLTVIALFSIVYAWRYVWCLLKRVSKTIYFITFALIILQYLAENQIGFGHISGNIVEELCEFMIYLIAFFYLLRFKVDDFNHRFVTQNSKS